jgi:E3 ubiquitin-protein ligase DOA10
MKASDSTNSLTELTGRDECFICLSSENNNGEPLVTSKLLRTCGCKFFVHPECWNEWMKDKSDYDCPICRKANILRISIPPNPVLLVELPRERPLQFSYLRCLICTGLTGFCIAITLALLLSQN